MTEKLISASPISAIQRNKPTNPSRGLRMNKKLILMVLTIVLTLGLAVLAIDSRLKTVCYTVENPKSETPLRIAFISDLHSCLYGGSDQSDLLEAVRAQNPDMVLLGGDIFDSRRMPDDGAITALKALGSEYTCYYVSGNHEVRHEKLDYYKEIVASCGVTVLDGFNTKIAILPVISVVCANAESPKSRHESAANVVIYDIPSAFKAVIKYTPTFVLWVNKSSSLPIVLNKFPSADISTIQTVASTIRREYSPNRLRNAVTKTAAIIIIATALINSPLTA